MDQISLPVAMVAVAVLAGITADLVSDLHYQGRYCFHQDTAQKRPRFGGGSI